MPRAASSNFRQFSTTISKRVLGTDHAALAQHGSDDLATPTQAGYRQRPWMPGRASKLQAKSVSMCGRRCTSQQKIPQTGDRAFGIIRWGKADVSREASLPPVVTMIERHYLKASEYKAQGGGVAELCPRRDAAHVTLAHSLPFHHRWGNSRLCSNTRCGVYSSDGPRCMRWWILCPQVDVGSPKGLSPFEIGPRATKDYAAVGLAFGIKAKEASFSNPELSLLNKR